LAVAAIAVGLVASVTRTVNELVPVCVGVPLIRPEAESRLSPFGSAPLVILQVSGLMPTIELSVREYALPTVAGSRCVVVIVSFPGAITITTGTTEVTGEGLPLSVRAMPTTVVPVAVGVPEITPPGLSLSPPGNVLS
jgi:hypothetical protein